MKLLRNLGNFCQKSKLFEHMNISINFNYASNLRFYYNKFFMNVYYLDAIWTFRKIIDKSENSQTYLLYLVVLPRRHGPIHKK